MQTLDTSRNKHRTFRMSKRKGQMSQSTINRLWPYQVAILAVEYRGPMKGAIDEFCKPYPESSSPHQVHYEGEGYLVKCFPEKAIADEFVRRFGGEPLDPRDRGKGHFWFRWDKGKSQAKPSLK